LERTQLRQIPERGSHDWSTIGAILDAGFLANVGFCVDGQPVVIPMLYGRRERALCLHGSAASRVMRELDGGVPACLAVTLVDGLVLARSAFHHSMNYRSVVAFGRARALSEPRDKIAALRVISDHLIAGRWDEVRGPNKQELGATTVLEFAVEDASAKVRQGPPCDEASDYARPVWAGVLPLATQCREPVPDERLAEGVGLPDYVSGYDARLNSIRSPA
jgi:nitroimidazol reductase NimA-like FMN-containing flavoprotein (pyridoxamine 5'-phosphate oxidase superfamily)